MSGGSHTASAAAPTPLRILVAHPGAEMYGSDRVLLDSVLGFLSAGHRVVATIPERGALSEALESAGADVRVKPAFVLRKRLLKPRGWGELLRTGWGGMRSMLYLMRTVRPDVVYVSTITLPLASLLPRLFRVPVALHVHEGEAGASTLMKKLLYAPASAARRILINSAFSLDVMGSTYPRLRSRTIIVPNAVPGPASPTPPRPALDDVVRLLYLGRLSPRKGPDLIVDALPLLEERGITATLDLVGSVFEGYEDYEAALREAIDRIGGDERVVLHGFQSEVWTFLERADILIVPSRLDEPFGNTAVEGVLAERPVVVTDTSGLREATAGIRTAVRIRPGSAAAIADGIVDIVTGWDTVRAEVADARALADKRHAPSAYRRRVADLVTEIVS